MFLWRRNGRDHDVKPHHTASLYMRHGAVIPLPFSLSVSMMMTTGNGEHTRRWFWFWLCRHSDWYNSHSDQTGLRQCVLHCQAMLRLGPLSPNVQNAYRTHCNTEHCILALSVILHRSIHPRLGTSITTCLLLRDEPIDDEWEHGGKAVIRLYVDFWMSTLSDSIPRSIA